MFKNSLQLQIYLNGKSFENKYYRCNEDSLYAVHFGGTVTDFFFFFFFFFAETSGGDVRITTIDGVEYDFNGHGEYVFLNYTDEYVCYYIITRIVRVAERIALLTSVHEVSGSNLTGDGIQLMITTVHCTEPFIITLLLSPYDLNNIERDVKH